MTNLSAPNHGAWGIILAGGDGTRLRPLTVNIEGDQRPKQFCRVLGTQSLFAETRRRMAPLFDRTRIVAVVTKKHEAYYQNQLATMPDTALLVQPLNRGTGVAIASAILMLRELDDDAVAAFFPSDHYYGNEPAFLRAVHTGLQVARENPDMLVLLGATPAHSETGYGWIETEPLAAPPSNSVPARVRHFWEKPDLPSVQKLLRLGCLWNTSVTIGRVSAFIKVLCAAVPKTVLSLSLGTMDGDLSASYRAVLPVHFSRDVLASQPEHLLVIRDAASRWTDLGSPSRVLETIACEGLAPHWLERVGSLYLPLAG
ncbi:sugar phosphate nucleotidyltransferase [Paludibaculum fermentans]|uniref:sugar phosphate nucleotidyltransferase n=1 Tax=Paludibaculum fermentans TaxID=1473598 RepID=UPI003EBAA083